MKLPVILDVSAGTQIHYLAVNTPVADQAPGIFPQYVLFENNLYGRSRQMQLYIISLLRNTGGWMRNEARSFDRDVIVTTGWHTSNTDREEHLTVYVPRINRNCHVYQDGSYTC